MEQGKPWIDYMTRCQFLLQQGRSVADVAYFTGESAPVEMRVAIRRCRPDYDYDGINADVLLHRASVRNGELVLKSGMRYHVLILPPSDRNTTPPLLRRTAPVRRGRPYAGGRAAQSLAQPRGLPAMRR